MDKTKTKKYTVTLKSKSGKAISKVKVTIKIWLKSTPFSISFITFSNRTCVLPLPAEAESNKLLSKNSIAFNCSAVYSILFLPFPIVLPFVITFNSSLHFVLAFVFFVNFIVLINSFVFINNFYKFTFYNYFSLLTFNYHLLCSLLNFVFSLFV